MMSRSPGIGFLDDPQALGAPGAALVAVITDAGTKEQLIATLAEQLAFPKPHGTNWDALDEMLRRLDWLDAKSIIIAHDQIPVLPRGDLLTYVSVLREANRFWQSRGDRHLIAFFPSSSRSLLEGSS
jgi:hypothetical protein